jgi:hypothetical protein
MSDPLIDGGRLVKMEVDYSSTCDEKIPECQKMAAAGQLNEALEALLSLEKQTRTVSLICFSFTANLFLSNICDLICHSYYNIV